MATAPTAGYFYLIESDSGDNDDWITDHAGDPDLLDLDAYTEGTEYCKIEMPKALRVKGHTGAQVTDSGAGMSYVERTERSGYGALANGIQT